MDEETSNYVNKQGKRPIFTFEKNDVIIRKIFSLYKERFNYTIYDIENKHFLTTFESGGGDFDTFKLYPCENMAPNGKIVRRVEPLNQYIDSYGSTRLVEFQDEQFNFVGQFQPLPCLKLPTKPIEYFISINAQLSPQQTQELKQKYSFLQLYDSKLDISERYNSVYSDFKNLKKLAEYILWAACYAYSISYIETEISVDDWINGYTQVVEDYTYSRVSVKPIFNLNELVVNGKFIFNSKEFQNRIRYNLSLIPSTNLRLYTSNIYNLFYKDVSNFKVIYPAQLALTKRDYFLRTREPYILNI